MNRELAWRERGIGDRPRVEYKIAIRAYVIRTSGYIYRATDRMLVQAFRDFRKSRQHLPATRLRYGELFKRPGPISINVVPPILDSSKILFVSI